VRFMAVPRTLALALDPPGARCVRLAARPAGGSRRLAARRMTRDSLAIVKGQGSQPGPARRCCHRRAGGGRRPPSRWRSLARVVQGVQQQPRECLRSTEREQRGRKVPGHGVHRQTA
jgi:hypothetical protein